MKKSNIFFAIFCLMTLFAVGYVWHSLNHPEISLTWNNTALDNNITYTIYAVYLIVDVIMLVMSFVLRRK